MQDMFNDEITQSIAKTVSDVLEGKKPDISDYCLLYTSPSPRD